MTNQNSMKVIHTTAVMLDDIRMIIRTRRIYGFNSMLTMIWYSLAARSMGTRMRYN